MANEIPSCTAGPLPRFEGLTDPPPNPPPNAGGPIRVPPLNPDDVNKFISLFEKSDVQNGVISGTDKVQCIHTANY